MDIRTDIIQKVTEALQGRVNEETVGLVQDVLVMQLNQYEVTERCTEVAVRMIVPRDLLKKVSGHKTSRGDSGFHSAAICGD